MKNFPLMYLEAKPPKLRWNAWSVFVARRSIAQGALDLLDFVKDNAGGLRDSEDAHSSTNNSQGKKHEVIRAGEQKDIVVLYTIRLVRGAFSLGRSL